MFQKYLALWEDPKYHCGLRKKAEKNCKVEEDKEHEYDLQVNKFHIEKN